MIRYLKVLFIFLVAVWALICLASNLSELSVTYNAVHSITVMPAFKPGEGPPFATENPIIIGLGVAMILIGKATMLALCSTGVVTMLRAINADSATFQHAKRWGILGCGVGIVWLFFGFATVGENIFFMFLDPMGNSVAQTAFRYAGYIGVMMLFVSQPD